MPYTRKSEVGLMHGLEGKPKKESVVIHFQADEESSLIHYATPTVIPLLSFINIGHNTNYDRQAVYLHELQNFSTVNYIAALSLLPPVTATAYDDNSLDGTSIARDGSLPEYTHDYASAVFYTYKESATRYPSPTECATTYRIADMYTDSTGILFPNVPTPLGWKSVTDESDQTNLYSSFATNPLITPVLIPVANDTIDTTERDVTGYNVKSAACRFGSGLSTLGAVSLRDKVVLTGDSGGSTAIGSTAWLYPKHWWGNGASTGYRTLRGLFIEDTEFDNGYSDDELIVIQVLFNDYEDDTLIPMTIAFGSGATFGFGEFKNTSLWQRPIHSISMFHIVDAAHFISDAVGTDLEDLADFIHTEFDGTYINTYKVSTTYSGSMWTHDLSGTCASFTRDGNGLGFITPSQITSFNSATSDYIYQYSFKGLATLIPTFPYNWDFQNLVDGKYTTSFSLNSYGLYGTGVNDREELHLYVGINAIEITAPEGITTSFKFATNLDRDWDSQVYYEGDGWGSAYCTGVAGINSGTIPQLPSFLCYTATRSDYAGKVYDPTILSDYISYYYTASCSANQPSEYIYNEVIQGVGLSFTKDSTAETIPDYNIKAGVAILSNNDSGSEYDILIPDVDREIGSVSINILHYLNEHFALTEVNLGDSRYYLGIQSLDVDGDGVYRHYSPHHLVRDFDYLIYDTPKTITKVNVLRSSDQELNLQITDADGYSYMRLFLVGNIPGSIFIPDTMKAQTLLETYRVEDGKAQISKLRYTSETQVGYGKLTPESLIKNIGLIEHDNIMGIYNHSGIRAELNSSSVITMPTSTMLNNAVCYIDDVTQYAVDTISVPMPYPTLSYGMPTINTISYGASAESGTLEERISHRYFYISTNMLQYHDLHTYPQVGFANSALAIITLPGVDGKALSYSVIPKKITEHLYIDNTNLIDTLGENPLVMNEHSYIAYANNLYASSVIALARKDTVPFLDVQGYVYSLGNKVFVVGDNATFVYGSDGQGGMNLYNTITGRLLTTPLQIGQDVVLCCHNGIYTLNKEMILAFDNDADRIMIKSVAGYGHMIITETTDDSGSIYPYLYISGTRYYPILDGCAVGLEEDDPGVYLPSTISTRLYVINNDLNISKLDIPDDLEDAVNAMKILNENIQDNRIEIYDEPHYGNTADTLTIPLYEIEYSTGVPDNNYLLTAPLTFRDHSNPDNKFIAQELMIDYSGEGTIDITIYRDDSEVWASSTITLDGGTNSEIFALGSTALDGVQVRIDFTPTAQPFKILNLYAIGEYKENYQL